MYRKESFTEIFIQEMIINYSSEWSNFEKDLMRFEIFVDYGDFEIDEMFEPFLNTPELVEKVFLVF